MRTTLACALLSMVVGCTVSTTSAPATGGGGSGDPAASSTASFDGIVLQTFATGTSIEFRPVILLHDGRACDCADQDLDSLDVDAVAKQHPREIGEWRQNGTDVELRWSPTGSWSRASRAAALALGDGWRSSKSYTRVASIGSVGTDSYVGVAKTITFEPGGTFRWSGATATGTGTAGTSKSGGTYAVAGWMMTLTFDDGRTLRMSALTSGDAPGGTLWLSGAAYSDS